MTSYNMVVAWGGMSDAKGVWEDGAPMYSVGATASLRPGTFYYDSGTSRLYIRTYESDDPTNHVMEYSRHWTPTGSAIYIQDKTAGGIAADYLILEYIHAEKGQLSGVTIDATTLPKNSVTLRYMEIVDNSEGIAYVGASAITVQNCTIWGTGRSVIGAYNGSANATTINITNSILGGQMMFNTFRPGSGGTINILVIQLTPPRRACSVCGYGRLPTNSL